MEIYEIYKPLRNYIRQLDLTSSLECIWRYSQCLHSNSLLPLRFKSGQIHPIKGKIHPWELSLLAREVILHASNGGNKNLGTYSGFIATVNQIRRVEEEISKRTINQSNVMSELHKMAHRQFPWQSRQDITSLMRYLKIFGEDKVEEVLLQKTGLTMGQIYVFGLSIFGHLEKFHGINVNQNYTEFGIEAASVATFFKLMSLDINSAKEVINAQQSYDENWAYTWNPLEARPLIALNSKMPNFVHCPIPELLMLRITKGIFYDLVDEVNFDNPFGIAYQRYVGEAIRDLYPSPKYLVMSETQYQDGKNIKHGVDWILSDENASIFIECKTKRLRHASKLLVNISDLDGDITIMASAIVQLYKNINDAINGKTNWTPNEKPIYPLIITLENWYLLAPNIIDMLSTRVRHLLVQSEISLDVLEKMPYQITSIDEFEVASRVISTIGIQSFFSRKINHIYESYMLLSFTFSCFNNELINSRHTLFKSEWKTLIERMSVGWQQDFRDKWLDKFFEKIDA